MKIVLSVFALLALVVVVFGEKLLKIDIVQENAICLEEIKALELCLSEAGQGKGWCSIGEIVKIPIEIVSELKPKFHPQIHQKQLLFA